MVLKNEVKLMANTKLLKTIGLYQILNSSSPKVFGYNIFKCLAIIEAFIAVAVVLCVHFKRIHLPERLIRDNEIFHYWCDVCNKYF